jgi:seryl-tRNA synthetase
VRRVPVKGYGCLLTIPDAVGRVRCSVVQLRHEGTCHSRRRERAKRDHGAASDEAGCSGVQGIAENRKYIQELRDRAKEVKREKEKTKKKKPKKKERTKAVSKNLGMLSQHTGRIGVSHWGTKEKAWEAKRPGAVGIVVLRQYGGSGSAHHCNACRRRLWSQNASID